MRVIDISNPTNPVVAGSGVDIGGGAYDLCVSDEMAFRVGNGQYLQVIDMGNVAAPTIACSIALPGEPRSVYYAESYVFVGSLEGTQGGGLYILSNLPEPGTDFFC